MTAAITATITIPANVRCFRSPIISSIANTIAANGVLNASAPPEQSIGINAITCLGAKPNQRPTYEANAAESYTVGPSRPRLAPVRIDIVPKINLLIAVRNRIRPNFK